MSDVAPASAPGAPPRLVVGAAVVDDLDAPRFLLAGRRSEPPALAGRWEFPGGKVEAGETPVEALRRELHEELGVQIEVGDEVVAPESDAWPLGKSPVDGQAFVLRLWWARIGDGEPRLVEGHDELRWLGPGEWRDVDWVDGDLPVLEALIADSVRRNRASWC